MLSNASFYLIAVATLISAVAAMRLRNLVHCALGVAGTFTGLAALYLQLDAEFVGFAQVLVYVGAVAILIVFTVLLTRGAEVNSGLSRAASGWATGLGVAVLILSCIMAPIFSSPTLDRIAKPGVQAPVQQIGQELMTRYVLPL